MKSSEVVELIWKRLGPLGISEETCSEVLEILEEAGLQPKKYVNPKAIEEFGDVIKEKGEHWGYIHYIDKYPEHYFVRGRPYEYYLEGWEPEDEA